MSKQIKLSFSSIPELVWHNIYCVVGIVQALLRMVAHTESGLALDWNPTQAWLLATGSRDRTVKVWDLASIPAIASSAQFEDTSSMRKNGSSRFVSRNSSLSFSGNAGALQHTGSMCGALNSTASHKPRFVLHTSSNVGRVSWRPMSAAAAAFGANSPSDSSMGSSLTPLTVRHESSASSFGDDSGMQQGPPRLSPRLSGTNVSTQLASTSSTERGEICVWDINRSTNLPACLLRGHSDGCTGFVWLETQSPVPPPSPMFTDTLSPSLKHTNSSLRPHQQVLHKSSLSLVGDLLSPLTQSISKPESLSSSSTDGEKELHNSGIFQHLLTIGKDGKVLVQDLRNAYFPGA